MTVDWPLAGELVLVFAVMSYVRWRWLRTRLRRLNRPPEPPDPPAPE